MRSDDGGGSFTNTAAALPAAQRARTSALAPTRRTPTRPSSCVGSLWQTDGLQHRLGPDLHAAGGPGGSVICYAIARDNTYYAGTNTGRIYVGWAARLELEFVHPSGAAVYDLVIDPNDAPTVLYAAFGGGNPRVYRFKRTAPPVLVRRRCYAPSVALSFGLLRALGGATGLLTAGRSSPTLPVGLTVKTLAVDAMRPFTIYAGTNRGVYRATSTDEGPSWSLSDYNLGLPPADVRALRVQASTGVLRAGTFGRSAYQVSTDAPLGSLLNATGRLTFLRAHDVGTGWGSPPNTLDADDHPARHVPLDVVRLPATRRQRGADPTRHGCASAGGIRRRHAHLHRLHPHRAARRHGTPGRPNRLEPTTREGSTQWPTS